MHKKLPLFYVSFLFFLDLACAGQNIPSSVSEPAPINWAPTIRVKLETKGLCIFSDQGLVFIVHDKGATSPTQFDLSSLWSLHTIIRHDEATIHVLKPAMPFSLRITPYLDLTMDPILIGDPTVMNLQLVKLQQQENKFVFKGVKTHKVVEFVHEGRRFQAFLTSQVDQGFAHQLEMRPYFRVLPSLQGVAVQVDSDAVSLKKSSNDLTISTPFVGYRPTQHGFWSQVHRYGNPSQLQPSGEPALSLCQAMQALHKGDGAGVSGIVNYLKELNPLMEYHPLVRVLLTWADYLMGRTCQTPYLLTLDDAVNWPGFYGQHPFCLAGFWEGVRWEVLPDPILKRIWEDAAQEAHYQQSFPSLRTLLNPKTAERSVPLQQSFYKLVVAQMDEPNLFPEMLKNFLQMEVLAPACPPDISLWARYQASKDHLSMWNAFAPLWQLHKDMEAAFKAKRYREVLAAIITTPFNPVLADVFQVVLEDKHISHVEKLGLYERIKTSLPIASCNQIVADVVSLWCDLDLTAQANTLLTSNQSVLSEDVRNRLWLSVAENYAIKRSWTDVENALRQISDAVPNEMRVSVHLQRMNLLWNTGHKEEALALGKASTEIAIVEQSARFLMEAERYNEAADQWGVLVELKDKNAVHPYALCLWRIKDLARLEILQKMYPENKWLEWVVNETKPHPFKLIETLDLAGQTLQQASELLKE